MPPARRAAASRAARRAEKRVERAGAPPAPAPRPLPLRALQVGVWWVVVGGFLALTCAWLEHRVTWYLAVDQFGYLTFAHDLLAGRIFHHSPSLDAVRPLLPSHTDVMAQTYVYDQGRLYCRYSPGWPMLLAAWIGLFGDDAAHYLNLTLFLLLLALLIAFQRRIFRSRWRALAGAALVLLFPTQVYLWSLTPTRDLSHHLFAFLGLYLLLPGGGGRLRAGRAIAAGLALGFAVTIRTEGVVYLIPAACLAALRLRRERGSLRVWNAVQASAALGLLIGLAPFLGYNWAATGNPFRPTQGMELDLFKPTAVPPPPAVTPPTASPPVGEGRVGYPSAGWHGGTWDQVQGGGLRLSNLRQTLPGNLRWITQAHGWVLVGAAVWGLGVSLLRRRALLLSALPYGFAALFLYSCWPRPDPRYLFGVFLFIPMLILEGTVGTLDLVRSLFRSRREMLARGLAVGAALALVGGLAFVPLPTAPPYLPTVIQATVILAAMGSGAAAMWPERRLAGILAPVLALVLVGLSAQRSWEGLASRASFQQPQMLQARATFQRIVEPNSLVITTEDVGRPAENIEYYSGVARAFYLTDLKRWRKSVSAVVVHAILAKQRPYLLLPAGDPERAKIIEELRDLTVETVADIAPAGARDYFVAAPFHRGLHMKLDRISFPFLEGMMKEKEESEKLRR